MNTVVEVDPKGPAASKLQVGDKIVAVDGQLIAFRKFVDIVGSAPSLSLRVARLRAAQVSKPSKSRREALRRVEIEEEAAGGEGEGRRGREAALIGGEAAAAQSSPKAVMPALREVKLVKETEDTKIGAVFHRLDDAFDKSFFNVEGSSVQPIIKKVDPGSMAEVSGLVPGDIVLSVNGVSGLSNFQVVEMLRKGQGVFYTRRHFGAAGAIVACAAAATADDPLVMAVSPRGVDDGTIDATTTKRHDWGSAVTREPQECRL